MIVSQLRTTGVNELSVLDALRAVPREDFVEPSRRPVAYADVATPAGGGRFLLPPEVLGGLIQKAGLKPGESALVIGGATGYAAAVLAEMGLDVTLLESDPVLAERARALLNGKARVVEGALAEGTKKGAPFDFILIDGAVEDVPAALIKLLRDGGRLATVQAGAATVGRAAMGVRADGAFALRPFADAPAAVRLPGFECAKAFQF